MSATSTPETRAAKRAINEQFDLFLPYLADLPLRDQREMMERPFFSLAKTKRVKPIDYTSPDGKLWVNVSANPTYGRATMAGFAGIGIPVSFPESTAADRCGMPTRSKPYYLG